MPTREKTFKQIDLIGSTGRQINEGICLGLVCQWLMAISKGVVGDENQFWGDVNGSLAKTPNVPLLGIGYARKAIEFQKQYMSNVTSSPSTGNHAQGEMNKAGLSLSSTQCNISAGAFVNITKNLIARLILSESGRYNILVIGGKGGRHAIGIYRINSAIGKGIAARIFDPNIGLYSCHGTTDIECMLDAIGKYYENGLHDAYLVETYS